VIRAAQSHELAVQKKASRTQFGHEVTKQLESVTCSGTATPKRHSNP
jgi:hypothetical protein